MKLTELVRELGLTPNDCDDREVTGGYASDLMSDVLGKAKSGDVWVTNQKHTNVIAVAALLGLSGVIMTGGVKPDKAAIQKAEEEGVPLFTTDASAFDVVGRLYSMGVRAPNEK